MNEWLIVLAAVMLAPYVVVPILIRRSHSFSQKPQLRLMLDGFLSKSVQEYFLGQEQQLAPLGFNHRIDVMSRDYGPHMRVFVRLFVSTQQSIMAMSTALVPDGENDPIKTFSEFSSRFSDGVEISTHNSDLMGAPIEHNQKIVSYFPGQACLKTLLGCHQGALKKRKLLAVEARVPDVGQEFSFLVQNFHDDILAQVDLGCLSYDKDAQCYRPTWAGAFLMGWYSMWPVSFIRLLLHKLRAKIILRRSMQANA